MERTTTSSQRRSGCSVSWPPLRQLLFYAVDPGSKLIDTLIGTLRCSRCRLRCGVRLLGGLIDRAHSRFESANPIADRGNMLVHIFLGCACAEAQPCSGQNDDGRGALY